MEIIGLEKETLLIKLVRVRVKVKFESVALGAFYLMVLRIRNMLNVITVRL